MQNTPGNSNNETTATTNGVGLQVDQINVVGVATFPSNITFTDVELDQIKVGAAATFSNINISNIAPHGGNLKVAGISTFTGNVFINGNTNIGDGIFGINVNQYNETRIGDGWMGLNINQYGDDINLNGMFLCAKYAFALMRKQNPQGGRIINNGSVSSVTPRPGSIPYTATKHAVTGMTKTISLDGRKYDIACSQIDIGNAETPMTQRMKEGVPQANGNMDIEPVIDSLHIAEAVLYMANLPVTVNVLNMTVMANKMPFVGRG